MSYGQLKPTEEYDAVFEYNQDGEADWLSEFNGQTVHVIRIVGDAAVFKVGEEKHTVWIDELTRVG